MRNITKRKLRRPPTHNEDGTITIHLTKGQSTVIDSAFIELAQFNWHSQYLPSYANGGGFIASRAQYITQRFLLLHREVMRLHLGRELLPSEDVDHIDTNTLNNRVANLRLATRPQNCFNTRTPKNNKSGIKGVSWHKGAGKWQVHIKAYGKNRYLGLYSDLTEAKQVITEARLKFHGQFTRHE